MGVFKFGGRTFDDASLITSLVEAAHGSVDSDNPDYMMNPTQWANDFSRAVVHQSGGAQLASAIRRLIGGDDSERSLGAELQLNHGGLTKDELAAAIVDAAGRKSTDSRKLLSAMATFAGNEKSAFRLPANVRDVILSLNEATGINPGLLVLTDEDADWIAAHIATLLGNDPVEQLVRAAYLGDGLSRAVRERLAGMLPAGSAAASELLRAP